MAEQKKIRPWPVNERAQAVEKGKGFQKFISKLLTGDKKKS